MKSKKQQIQFFTDCLLPELNVETDLIDLYSIVDSELSTSENWFENVKPECEKQVDRLFLTKKEMKAHIEKYEAKIETRNKNPK